MKILTEDQIQQILNRVPFDDIIAYMTETNWTWYTDEGNCIPNQLEIFSTIKQLILHVHEEVGSIRTGGFEVCRIDDKLSISFKLKESNEYFWKQTYAI